MNAKEIRSKTLRQIRFVPADRAFELEILQEIAAQLAELNQAHEAPTSAPPHWTRKAPTEPGFYWYRDTSGTQVVNAEYGMGYDDPEHIVFTIAGSGDGFDGEIMLRHSGEFWSVKLEEPK